MGDATAFAQGATKPGESYYLQARQEWRERYGEFVHSARVWRRVAFISLGVSLVSVSTAAYLGMRSRFVPYIIELGRDGSPVVAGFAGEVSLRDERVVKALLSSFITDLRSVVSDREAEKGAVSRLFHFIRTSDPSHQLLVEHFRDPEHDPFERAKQETVSVQVNSVLPVTKDTWQVEWTETVRLRSGGEKEQMAMKAMVTLDLVTPRSEELILHNPIGLFVKDLRWSKSL
jgi:type IV secretion system protein TrbF